MAERLVLVINPGSTSTKVGLFTGAKQLKTVELSHSPTEVAGFPKVVDQVDFRVDAISRAIGDWDVPPGRLAGVIGRGGTVRLTEGGVYRVDSVLLEALRTKALFEHASTLGGILAFHFSGEGSVPAWIADPVTVDEFEEIARISGLPELPRFPVTHRLNAMAMLGEVAAEAGKTTDRVNAIVAHLGGGVSISAFRAGRQVDATNAFDMAPFSGDRAGSLPVTGLIELCYSGKYSKEELKRRINGKGGLTAHLGTSDVKEVEDRVLRGDPKAALVLEAMAYAVAKEIGALGTVLEGNVDFIILTGGVIKCDLVREWISRRVKHIAPIVSRPGQNEMLALARYAASALSNPSIVRHLPA